MIKVGNRTLIHKNLKNTSTLFLLLKLTFLTVWMSSVVSYASAQTPDLNKLIYDEVARPTAHLISSALNKADPSIRCGVRYMSVKFIVDAKTFVCDTVIFSKSIANNLPLDQMNFKNLIINWKVIVSSSPCEQATKYEVIQPISLFRGECFSKYPKLRGDQIWDVYTDLIMLDRRASANVLILQPSNFASHK